MNYALLSCFNYWLLLMVRLKGKVDDVVELMELLDGFLNVC